MHIFIYLLQITNMYAESAACDQSKEGREIFEEYLYDYQLK